MKPYYIIYKCVSFTAGKYESIENWYGRFPFSSEEEAKQECRDVWSQHQGKEYIKEIILLDSEKDTLFEYRTHAKGSIPHI